MSKATNLKKKEFGFFMDHPRTPAAGLFCPPELKQSLFSPHVPSLLSSCAPETDFVTHLYNLLPADSTGVVHFLRHVILITCTGVQCQESLKKRLWNAVLTVYPNFY